MTDVSDTKTDADNPYSDWQVKDAAQARLRDELRPANKSALFEALIAANITQVIVEFDGCGDSGQIENIAFKNGEKDVPPPDTQIEIAIAKWGQAEPHRVTTNLADAIEEMAYDFLRETHDGWENNAGAYGEFTFDVAKRTIRLDINERYVESEHYEHSF